MKKWSRRGIAPVKIDAFCSHKMIKAYGVAHVWKTLRKSVQEKAKKQLHKQKKTTILNNLPISSTNEASENKQPTEQRHSDRVRIRKKSAFQQQEICGEEARRLAGMRSRLDRRPIDQETGERISGSHQRIRMMLKENQPTTPNSSSNSSSISIDCSIRKTKLFQNSMLG